MKEEIRREALSMGADVCGFADTAGFEGAPEGFLPTDVYGGCKSIVVFGVALPRGLAEVSDKLVYAHFNGGLPQTCDEIAFRLARLIEDKFGAVAVPLPSDSPQRYWDAEHTAAKGLISMKHAAVAAGLGQLGKSTLLLNPNFGNQLTIGAVLTNAVIEADAPCENICIPSCRICPDGCPAGAIRGGRVDQQLCRPVAYAKTDRGFDTVNCNYCRMACPMKFGKKNHS